jgi:hypothetical protein
MRGVVDRTIFGVIILFRNVSRLWLGNPPVYWLSIVKGRLTMRSNFSKKYRFMGLAVCLCLFLPAASFHREDQAVEQDRSSLLELLEGDGPLYDIIYDLEECYDRHIDILEEEERAARAEQAKVYEEFFQRMADLAGERSDAEARRQKDALAQLGREIQRLASEYDLQGLFPDSAEERFLRCQHHLRMARLRLKTARELNEAYREVLTLRGAEKYFPKETPEEWDLWREELNAFACPQSEERPPLRTRISIPAGTRRPFVLKTFCLDRNKLGPGDSQVLEIFGHAAFLGRANLEQQLKDVAAFPAQEIDVQEAIWEESEEEEGDPPPKAPKPVPSQKTDSSDGSTGLSDAVSNGEIDAELRTRGDFTSVEVWLENKSKEERVIDVSGTVFGTGDESVQRLVAAGIDTEQPPPGPDLKSPERTIEEIRDEVAKRLEEALERVRNGDHSKEALKELLEAMEAARNVGLDEPLGEAWDVFRDGIWEETVQSYEDYKADPSEANRTELLENLETVRQVDPPDGKQEEFNRMLEDIFRAPDNDQIFG